MNLTIDKWIPVVWHDGRHDSVSLNDVFLSGDKICDLSVRPHERIALMRLLVCIAQAALDGEMRGGQSYWGGHAEAGIRFSAVPLVGLVEILGRYTWSSSGSDNGYWLAGIATGVGW